MFGNFLGIMLRCLGLLDRLDFFGGEFCLFLSLLCRVLVGVLERSLRGLLSVPLCLRFLLSL